MKIAIIRGEHLSYWEMQNFIPLMKYHQLVGFTCFGSNYDIRDLPFQVVRLFSIGHSLRARILRKIYEHLIGDVSDLRGLEKHLSGFDIVHTIETFTYSSYRAAKLKKKMGFKLVVSVWENIPFLKNFEKTRKMKEVVFNEVDLFIAATRRAKESLVLEGVPEEKIKVLLHGVDIDFFKPLPKDRTLLKKFECEENDFIILFVGRLHRNKGIYDLIFAFRYLIDHLKNGKIKLLMRSSGKEKENITRWIRSLHLQDYVKIIGNQPWSDLPNIHNLADIFVLPSLPTPGWQEQFGFVLAESMACGKPIISTLSGSIPEVIGDAGELVQPNDFFTLGETMLKLYQNEERRNSLSVRARNRAEQLLNASKVSQQLNKYYESLIK